MIMLRPTYTTTFDYLLELISIEQETILEDNEVSGAVIDFYDTASLNGIILAINNIPGLARFQNITPIDVNYGLLRFNYTDGEDTLVGIVSLCDITRIFYNCIL